MKCAQIFVLVVTVLVGNIFWGYAMASEYQQDNLLERIVYDSTEILRKNGFDMPTYVVRDGASELPISSGPASIGFFAYIDTSWTGEGPSYKMHFYEADRIPIAAKMQLIDYLIKLHEEQGLSFTFSLRMMRDKYKKLQIIKPAATIELKLKRSERK